MPLPFEQQPRESAKAFAAFSLYLSLGPQRSMADVARKLAKSEGLIRRWAAKYDWTGRVGAHDTHLAVVEREAIEALVRAKATEWLKRQEAIREREWAMHERCMAAIQKALDAFMEKDKVYTNLADIARMLEAASKIGRLAAGMATEKTEVTGEDGGPIRVEVSAALDKIYGKPVPGEVVEVEANQIGGGE